MSRKYVIFNESSNVNQVLHNIIGGRIVASLNDATLQICQLTTYFHQIVTWDDIKHSYLA